VFGKNKKKSPDEIHEMLGDKIIETFGSLSTFYNAIREQGKEILEDLDVEKKLKKEFFEMVDAQIKKTRVTIKRVIEVTSHSGDGVSRIREVLQKMPKMDNIDIEICYLSAPKYSITIKANNYKEGEIAFDDLSELLKENARKKEVALKIENE
jgi:translation initiation factor 2 alpha subunit (eIF-2alpha)